MHDSIITKYIIDFTSQTIRLESYDEKLQIGYVLHAKGVLSHSFYHVQDCSIILDVEECELSHFLSLYQEDLEAGKYYHWPLYFRDLHHLEQILRTEQYRYISISSSSGLYGWILAKEFYIEETSLN